ncbi:MAG: pilus assembly protein TadG-related protein [Acidobacteriaceae bacterium]
MSPVCGKMKCPAVAGREGERGQVIVPLLLIFALVLIAAAGFAVDYSNLWMHRQMAQTAADAACGAGAMDMLAVSQGTSLPNMGFTIGTPGNCATNSSATMCAYARFNGYNGSGLNAGSVSNAVSWGFPATVNGITAPPTSMTAFPFMQVKVQDNVKMYFSAAVTGQSVRTVGASSYCGLAMVNEAAPIVVLHPTMSGAFSYVGGAILKIVGGPQHSLQVNSSSPTAIVYHPSALIDTSQGGPNQTGSDVGTFGGPQTAPAGYNGGTTGKWVWPASPVSDPYATVPAPAKPALSTTSSAPHVVTYGQDGCPDHSPTNYVPTVPHSGCLEFEPGYYPNGINLNGNDVAIFKPGVYYMDGGLSVGGSDDIRMAKPCVTTCSPYSTTTWQQTDGAMFYFHQGALSVQGGAGSLAPPRVDPINPADLTCDGSLPSASLGMPMALNGNVLVAQCTVNGTYWDSNGDTTDARGNPGNRGLLIFQDHGNTTTPFFGGSGTLSFSGAMYFHSTGYADQFQVTGAAASGTFILGQIVADQISMTGSGKLSMSLNSTPDSYILKAGIFQ